MQWPVCRVVAVVLFAKFNFTCMRGAVAGFTDNQNMYLTVGFLVNAKPETVA